MSVGLLVTPAFCVIALMYRTNKAVAEKQIAGATIA
jgi:hypothetical protein